MFVSYHLFGYIMNIYGYSLYIPYSPGRVGAQSGLGPGPGWGPYGPIYGPIWALMGPPGQVLEDYVRFPSTFRREIWTNFARFGSKTKFLIKFLNDSASFLLEKLKNHVILTPKP